MSSTGSITLDIPPDVEVNVEGESITVKGPLGILNKKFESQIVTVRVAGGKVEITPLGSKKFYKAYLGTIKSHIRNMIKGVREGYKLTLITAYSHFPIKVEVDDKRKIVLIHNFLGEKSPRVAKIVGNVSVEIVGEDKIVVKGISKEDVGQTAANIRLATRIKKKDQRVFQDGIYLLRGE